MDMITKFEQSKLAEDNVNRIAFYLGVIATRANELNHDRYVRLIKEGKTRINNLKDMQSLYVALERILEGDRKSKQYREIIADLFLSTSKKHFDNNDPKTSYGIGLSVGSLNNLDTVYTFAEAQEKWGLGDSTLRKAKYDDRFEKGEVRKSGSNWLVTHAAMKRLYGDPKTS